MILKVKARKIGKEEMQTQLFSDFDASKVTFGAFRKNKNSSKSVYITDSNKNKLYLELPYMRAPFGLSTYEDEKTKNKSYSLDLSFDKNDEVLLGLQEKFKKLDEAVVNLVAKNSVEWLGKSYNVNVLEQALFKPMVKAGKGDYASSMKLKILMGNNGEFVPEAYNMKFERVPLDSIEKGQRVKTIIDINQIWFVDNKFGITVRLLQVLMEPSKKLPPCAFRDIKPQAQAQKAASVAGSEEEGEEEEDEYVEED